MISVNKYANILTLFNHKYHNFTLLAFCKNILILNENKVLQHKGYLPKYIQLQILDSFFWCFFNMNIVCYSFLNILVRVLVRTFHVTNTISFIFVVVLFCAFNSKGIFLMLSQQESIFQNFLT